jgi:hypothetical protein
VRESIEQSILRETLDAVIASKWKPPNDSYELAGFRSLKGRKWSHDLMVVGRFANGWEAHDPWKVTQDPAEKEKFLQNVFTTEHHKAECPVSNFYKEVKRSPFWSTVREVAQRLGLGDEWTSRIVYSNLYRFGPDGGNPPAALCRAQREGCIKFLANEIASLAPRRVLLLTGWGWAQWFFGPGGIPLAEQEQRDGNVERVGTIAVGSTKANVVVSKHPQGKKREPLVAEILEAFKALDR